MQNTFDYGVVDTELKFCALVSNRKCSVRTDQNADVVSNSAKKSEAQNGPNCPLLWKSVECFVAFRLEGRSSHRDWFVCSSLDVG